MYRTITCTVLGMHCASCERSIEQHLTKTIDGIADVKASVVSKSVTITFTEEQSGTHTEQMKRALREIGYDLVTSPESTVPCTINPRDHLTKRLIRATLVVGATFFIGRFVLSLFALPAIDASASLTGIFLFGVIASLSTCLASTGGYLLAYSAKNPSKKRTLSIHIGRLVAFAIGGTILGALGQGLPTLGIGFYGGLSLILGIGFLLVGLNLLEMTPSLSSLGIKLPKRLGSVADRIAMTNHALTPFIVGASTFVLPCGFTQTTQAIALASGDPFKGFLIMTLFALGTLPVLGGLTTFGSLATLKHRVVRLIIGAVLVFFAFGQIRGGLTVLGIQYPFESAFSAQSGESNAIADTGSLLERQTIRMTVTATGYKPESLTVKVGIPVDWEIDGESVGGCTSEIVVPSLKIQKTLIRGTNLISFTPTNIGNIPFSCGMGMVRGVIRVID